jgi:hypothetical protein
MKNNVAKGFIVRAQGIIRFFLLWGLCYKTFTAVMFPYRNKLVCLSLLHGQAPALPEMLDSGKSG